MMRTLPTAIRRQGLLFYEAARFCCGAACKKVFESFLNISLVSIDKPKKIMYNYLCCNENEKCYVVNLC